MSPPTVGPPGSDVRGSMVPCPICLTVPAPVKDGGSGMECSCQRLFLLPGREASFYFGKQLAVRRNFARDVLYSWSGRWVEVGADYEGLARMAAALLDVVIVKDVLES